MQNHDLLSHFSIIQDYRQTGKIEHKLSDILLLVICAVIAGADGWEEIEDFGHDRLTWLQEYADFDNGIPSHDTLARVMSLINPQQFQRCFANWMQSCHKLTDGEVIAIDGKTFRGSYDKRRRTGAIHMVSAFSTANGVVLGQVKTDEKSNEITAIPELLKLLSVCSCLVTLDAMGCQKAIAQAILDKEANYLLAVKGKQKRLEEAFAKHFPLSHVTQYPGDYFNTIEKAHGRKETRFHIVSDVIGDFVELSADWPELKTLGVTLSFRTTNGEIPENATVRYYVSSATLAAKQFADAIRNHWMIENQFHWRWDVAMGEDDCRIRCDKAAENLTGIRHIAFNVLNNHKTFKAGMKRKQKKATMNTDYLSELLMAKGFS